MKTVSESHRVIALLLVAAAMMVVLVSAALVSPTPPAKLSETSSSLPLVDHEKGGSSSPLVEKEGPKPNGGNLVLLENELAEISRTLLVPGFIENVVQMLNEYTSIVIAGDSTARQFFTTFVALPQALLALGVVDSNFDLATSWTSQKGEMDSFTVQRWLDWVIQGCPKTGNGGWDHQNDGTRCAYGQAPLVELAKGMHPFVCLAGKIEIFYRWVTIFVFFLRCSSWLVG